LYQHGVFLCDLVCRAKSQAQYLTLLEARASINCKSVPHERHLWHRAQESSDRDCRIIVCHRMFMAFADLSELKVWYNVNATCLRCLALFYRTSIAANLINDNCTEYSVSRSIWRIFSCDYELVGHQQNLAQA